MARPEDRTLHAPIFLRWPFGPILQLGTQGSVSPASSMDPAFRRIMVYIFVGSRGGYNRVRIVELLRTAPMNPNQISEKLGLDYKTVQHHLRLLEENGVIVPNAKGTYGAMFFLTPYAEKHFDSMKGMWAGFGQS
jgi:DNA-binding transcriptional ArsR family regulator